MSKMIRIEGVESLEDVIETVIGVDKIAKNTAFDLAKEGYNVASSLLMNHVSGQDTPVVAISLDGSNFSLDAIGDSVAFLEFGAGLSAGQGYEGYHGDLDISPGSWSKNHAKMFTNDGFWIFKNMWFDSVLPRRGMYLAGKQIESKLSERVQRWLRDNG